jgi:hypothetical protein
MNNFLIACAISGRIGVIRKTMRKGIGIRESHGKEKGQPVG